MHQAFITIGSTTQAILWKDNLISSTGLRTFGIKLKASYGSVMVLQRNLFLFFLKECEFRFNYGAPNQYFKALIK